MIAVLSALAVVALAAAIAMGWPIRRPPAGLRGPPDDPAAEVERRFADAVEALRFGDAELHARRWFELADDRDPRNAGQQDVRRSTRPEGSWPPGWPLWWI